MAKYDIDWLKEKGFHEKIIPFEIEGKKVFVDDNNLLAYTKVSNNEEVERIRKGLFSSAPKTKYMWFYFPSEKKVKVLRKYGGELPWFWYKPELRKEFLKSREDKLNKFSVKNIDVLFDTRDIAKKFYWQLWEARIKLARRVKDLEEDGNKLLVVQHLIDRLIFFYFLAQLGFVKIKNKEIDWKLDRKHTREFFEWICKKLSEEDLQGFLNKVFFDVLGEVKKSGWSYECFKIGGEKFSVAAPSLNGGLFVEKEFEGRHEREIRIKGTKELILEILNNYNWVIGEELPEEEDVIGDLTPEIIGHIYEKFVVSLEELGKQLKRINLNDIKTVKGELRAGRKKIGAYYTPTEITNYISMNTIYPYITDRINNEFKTNYKNIWDELLNKERLTRDEVNVITFLYFDVLKELKICDNACGSGSFLIAAGDVLLRLYSKIIRILEENLSKDKRVKKITGEIRKSPTRNYFIVREIITNNLYGVDIMEGAVEIAKLRFWLWLISQIDPKLIGNKRIETLPNLDFNLMVGNSLIGFVEKKIVAAPAKRKDKLIGKNLKTKYLSLASFEYQNRIKRKEKLVDKFKIASGEKRKKLKETIDEIDKKSREYLNKRFYELLQNKKINISREDFLKLKPFHWGYEFPKVFGTKNPEERGFDVIIGNPPYGNLLSKIEKEIGSILYESYISEIADIFVERSSNTLKNRGYLSYVITFAITFNKALSKTRKIIYENFDNTKILTFDRDRCRFFVGMSQSVSIILCNQKGSKKCDFYTSKFFRETSQNFGKISTVRSSDYLLGNSVGVSFDVPHRLPKIGEKISENILKKLIKHDQRVGDVLGIGSKIWIRTSGNYWYNAFNRKPYDSSKIKSILIDDKYLHFALVLINSSLFYFWFRIFGDGRDMNSDIYEAFPLPKRYIEKYNPLLMRVSEKFMKDLFLVFDRKRKKFLTSKIKGSIDMLDLILGKYIYNLSYFELNYILNYDKEIRGGSNLPNPYCNLMDYMLFFNKIEDQRKSEKELIEFIDKQITDPLVYELYFKEELKTNLLQLVEPYLKDVENLKPDEEKLITIKHVVKKIKTDRKIMGQIAKIKSHPWVKVIEEKA